MTKRYHVVYKVQPEIGTGNSPRIGEEVAASNEKLYRTINVLLNRNEDVLGVYVTGSDFGTRDETFQLRELREYLEGLEQLTWGGKKI